MTVLPLVAATLLVAQAAAKSPAPAVAATDLPVTVSYTGKGTIDANHKLIVWTFTDGNITSASRPTDTKILTKNNETVTFKDVKGPIYLFAVFDDKGGYDGVSGPPPAGIPATTYKKVAKGPATAVKPGAAVKFVFNDTERWTK